jgi:2-(1,2-epoxy-1,2-dihydrophenyl)acetyl-CoA isomerase
MDFKTILFEQVDGVAIIKLNRPHVLNAFTVEVLEEFAQALDLVEAADSTIRCVLLTGVGKAFSSGADLAASKVGNPGSDGKIDAGAVLESHFNPLFERLMKMPVPLVTAVNGAAAGAGCSFAIAGDIVIAAQSAYFLQAFVNIGLIPDVGSTWLLPRLIGKARAQAMMMLGRRVSAEEALDWGMIYQVSEDQDLMANAMSIATKLAKGPTKSLALIRHQVRSSYENTLTEQLQVERQDQLKAGQTADFVEGVSAFLQKRHPVFQGK